MNLKLDVFVRAMTSDGYWASVNAADLDERSFRRLILSRLAEAGAFAAMERDKEEPLTTNLTKEETERR